MKNQKDVFYVIDEVAVLTENKDANTNWRKVKIRMITNCEKLSHFEIMDTDGKRKLTGEWQHSWSAEGKDCGVIMKELLMTMLENLIYDITSSAIKNWKDRYKWKHFIRELRRDISRFCKKNESIYIDSSAFDYFIRNADFLENVVRRSIATKLEKSEKEFLRNEIKKAKEIAVAEGIIFENSEERVIQDLFYLIKNVVGTYYRNSLSVEQRYMVNLCLNQLAELKEAVNANHEED